MILYTKEKQPIKININRMERIRPAGVCSEVFHDDKIIFKKYYSHIHPSCKISPNMFKFLKSISNENFMELYDILCEKKRIKFRTDAYTAKYYCPEKINILEQPTDYILDNFRELDRLFQIFTNERVKVADMKFDNSILTSNKIIIIDPDLFHKSLLPKKNITLANKLELLALLRSILINTVKTKDYEILTGNLFDFEINHDTDIAYELSKKLKPYKKNNWLL